jgi:hypothetical protein
MRSTSRSELFADARFDAPPNGDSSSTLIALSNSCFAPFDVARLEFELARLGVTIRLREQGDDRIFDGRGRRRGLNRGTPGLTWRCGGQGRLPARRATRGHERQQREESQCG